MNNCLLRVKWWSFIKYGYEALFINEFGNRIVPGAELDGRMFAAKPGNDIIREFGMDPTFFKWDIIIMIGE